MRSDSINSELVRAIEESRIVVVILSKNYASSSWCLNELQLIMEGRVNLDQTVMTIFYDVDSSDVRNQTGEFGKAFEQTCDEKTEEEKQRWRQALSQVAVIVGEHSASWGNETEMISKIVRDVANELPSTDFNRLVGIEAHVAKMKSMMCLESDKVKIVEIWGPSGIGKSTIARALYKQVSCNFQLKFYKEDVDGIQYDDNYLQNHLENELLSGILDHRDMKIPDIQEAQLRLRHQRVLLILDDVSSNELKAFGNLIQGLRFGSKVVVTSEDVFKLKTNGINQIYKVVFPAREEALQILSYSAFGQKSPPRSYLEKAIEAVRIVDPFPLDLKVIGSSLRGKTKDEWTTILPTFRKYLKEGYMSRAKVIRFACNGLSTKQEHTLRGLVKSIPRGKDVNNKLTFLETAWDVEEDIQALADMALISKSENGEIMVHGLVRNMVSTTSSGTRLSVTSI
ncbi:hypothetical protein AALP_AA8G193000 [Arabis alpina]|uniref:TIR domain-containing protein n=1 Tax=Arabis alpina TaxID=50452 RepID=A0A087G817_ARAAL|nr:hypothetical protein AALP_AA8G193000 [Arabis alpina]